jgi:hypothetical protein
MVCMSAAIRTQANGTLRGLNFPSANVRSAEKRTGRHKVRIVGLTDFAGETGEGSE